jgi:DNA primase
MLRECYSACHQGHSPGHAVMPGIDYHQVRQQVSMAQVLGLIRFQTAWRRGPQLRGLCPIPGCCSSSHRSFSVHLTRQLYHCFACGSRGNPLDLWAAVRRLPLHTATVDLCRTAGLPLPWLPSSSPTSTISDSQPVPSRLPSSNR